MFIVSSLKKRRKVALMFNSFTESSTSSFIESNGQEFNAVIPSPSPLAATTTTAAAAVKPVPSDSEQAVSVESKGKSSCLSK